MILRRQSSCAKVIGLALVTFGRSLLAAQPNTLGECVVILRVFISVISATNDSNPTKKNESRDDAFLALFVCLHWSVALAEVG